MSDNRTRTGARLRSHQHGFTYRLAQMRTADYEQPKCMECSAPIHDDRLDYNATFCSSYCASRNKHHRVGRTLTHGQPSGREKRWAGVLAEARSAHGKEIAVSCESQRSASVLATMFRGKRDFDARYDGSTVFVWFVTA